MNSSMVLLRKYFDSSSTSEAFVKYMSNDSGDAGRSIETLSEIHRKEDVSIYKTRVSSFRALIRMRNEFGFLDSI